MVELKKKLIKSIVDTQLETVDSENEDIYSDAQDMETAVKWHSELSSQHKFNFVKDYYPPFEPDGNQVKLWLRGMNLGNDTRDWSGFNNTASMYGDPTLVNGTLDLGYQTNGTKSIALRLNRPTSDFENEEYLAVPDTSGLQLASASTGFSVFVRIRPLSLEDQGGRSPTIFAKIDDSTPSNGVMLQMKDDGKLVFIVKKGGSTTAKETAADTISTSGSGSVIPAVSFDPVSFDPVSFDTVLESPSSSTTIIPYDIFVTWTVSGSVIHIYVDGVDKTLTTFGGSVNWHEDLTDHDLFIGRRGTGAKEGFCYMDFYDFKAYYNRIVNQTEVTRHYTNKWTISNIAFGHVMIANHFATYTGTGGEEGSISFTGGSFSPSSFTVS